MSRLGLVYIVSLIEASGLQDPSCVMLSLEQQHARSWCYRL